MAEKSVTKQIVGTALFSALAFVISLLEFPIFPSASFLQLDFSMVFIGSLITEIVLAIIKRKKE